MATEEETKIIPCENPDCAGRRQQLITNPKPQKGVSSVVRFLAGWTRHRFSRKKNARIGSDSEIMYRCDVCGTERVYGTC